MAVDVIMPQMGESIFEGTITKWLKKPGDRIERDEPLFEISTDKVDAEIPAPSAGVLKEIKVTEGQTVPIQTVVAVIDAAGAAAAAPGQPLRRRPRRPKRLLRPRLRPRLLLRPLRRRACPPRLPPPAPRRRAACRARQRPENSQLPAGPEARERAQRGPRRDRGKRRGRAHQQERYSRRARVRRARSLRPLPRARAVCRSAVRVPQPPRRPGAAPSRIRRSKTPSRASGFISATTKPSR